MTSPEELLFVIGSGAGIAPAPAEVINRHRAGVITFRRTPTLQQSLDTNDQLYVVTLIRPLDVKGLMIKRWLQRYV